MSTMNPQKGSRPEVEWETEYISFTKRDGKLSIYNSVNPSEGWIDSDITALELGIDRL